MTRKATDFWVVIALLAITATVWYIFALKAIFGLSLFTLIPGLYLWYRKNKNLKKIAVGTLLVGFCFGLIFDPIQVLNGSWYTDTLFPSSLFGLPIVIDNIVGYIVMAFFTLIFYEHFLDDEKKRALSSRWSKFALLCVGLVALTILVLLFHPFELNYSYAKLGFAAAIIPLIFLAIKPRLITKFAVLGSFFFGVWLLAEMVALSVGNWGYSAPSHYIGWVSLFSMSFPLEELVLWMVCYAAVIVSFYEYFIDDGK